jgi:anthranilate/para-aminobenzoate synthase component I
MHVLPLDLPVSPAELALRLADLPGLTWLDGEARHRDGRFSFLGAAPVERIELPLSAREPLAALDRLEPVTQHEADDVISSAPLSSEVPRWIGYVAYDACLAEKQQRLARPGDRLALSFARYDALIALDHRRHLAFVVGDDRAACQRLLRLLARRQRQVPRARIGAVGVAPAEQHRRTIAAALDHIAAGDVYQVNLARCWCAAFEGAPLALFLALRAASSVPFGFYHDDGARVSMSRTMERFLRWDRAAGTLLSRPIKGTIARHGDRDRQEAEALCSDDKERAEHAMIVDLMRNDLGRVAEVGSVHVPEVMAVEPYARLSHLVSSVTCRTRSETTLRQVLEATFPPGSVTGTPKLRAIEIIEQLEGVPRDVYSGAVGFVDRAGGLSLAVAIRTAIAEPGLVRYFAGGGIVEASRIEHEIAETELKARVFLDAVAALGTPADELGLSGAAVLR